MRKNISPTLVRNISPLSLLVLGACAQTSVTSGIKVSGIVQNGPLENAFAFLDYDDDGIFNNDDVGVLTKADGSYQLTTTKTEEYTLVATTTATTVDAATGAGYGAGVTLKAPEGSSMITPNTTLIENILSDKALGVASVGLTAADVTANVAKALGLEGADLLNFNAYADDTSFTDDQKETALKVQLSNNKIMTVVNSFAAAGEGSGLTEAVAFETALGSVVKVLNQKVKNIDDNATAIAAGGAGKTAAEMTLDFTTDADLTLINGEIQADVLALQVAGAAIDTTQFNNVADSAQSAIKLVVDKIDTITIADVLAGSTSAEDMGNIFSIVNVLKEEVQAAALVVKGGGALNIAMASDAGITAALTNKAPTDLQLSGSVTTTDETDGSTSPETVTIDENVSGLDLIVGTVKTIDAGQPVGVDHKYAVTADLDGAYFAIDESSGLLSFIASPDFESKSSYKVAVQVTDAGYKSFVEIFNVSINNINEIPTLTVATDGSVMEAAAINTIKDSLVGTDPENDALTYKVVGQTATSGTYTVDGTYGTLALNESTGAYTYTLDNSLEVVKALGAESKETESFSVVVTDGTLTTVAQTLSFEILGENGVPTLAVSTGETVTEDVSPNTIIGQLTGVDPEGGALDYQVADKTVSDGKYTVTGDYGTLVLTAATGAYTYTLDNTKASVQALGASDTKTESFSVKVSDGFTLTDAQNLILTIKGANDAPSDVALSSNKVVEGTAGAIVGAVSATDIESDTITYSIADAGYGASFEIDASNNLKLKSTVKADLVAKSSYSVTVNANDGTDTTATAFTVSVTDVNDAPTLTVPATVASVTEDAATSEITGTLVGSDPESSALDYQVADKTVSDGKYTVTGDYGTLVLIAETGFYTYTLDNTKASVQALGASDTKTESFSVKVSDGELSSATENLTFTIKGAYDAAPLLSAKTTVSGTTISVSIYADKSVASELDDGLGALDLVLGYDASAVSLDTATLKFLTGFTGLAGVQDTTEGTLAIGGYAYPSTTDFDSPLIQFDLAASSSLADTELSFSLLAVDDVSYPDQTLPLDIV